MKTDDLVRWIARQRRRGHSLQQIFDFGLTLGLDAYAINQAINLYNKQVQHKKSWFGSLSKNMEVGILCSLLGILILVASGLAFSLVDSGDATVSGSLIHPENYLLQDRSFSLSGTDSNINPLQPISVVAVPTQDESFEDSGESDSGSSLDSSFDDLRAQAQAILDNDEEYLSLDVNRSYIEAYWHPAITAALEPFDEVAVVIGNDRHVVYLDDGEFVDIDENSDSDAEVEFSVEDKGDLAYCRRAIEEREGYSSCLKKIDVPYYLYPGMVKRATEALIDDLDA